MSLMEKLTQRRLDEYAQELADYYKAEDEYIKQTKLELLRRLDKSKEYRIMLRDYQQELRAREQALQDREQALDAREKAMRDELMKEVDERELQFEKRTKGWKEYESSLRRAEFTVIDWLKRVDRKEVAAFDEILADVERFKQYMEATPKMDGFQFEEYVAGLLMKNGYANVQVTQKTQDFGADITAENQGVRYVIQCKYYTSQVGVEAVQQIYAAKIHYDAHIAVVATNSVYTRAAKILAEELNVVLWDGGDIGKMKKKN